MTLRVVQWTTGRTGSAAVRSLVGHPELELVGCYAWSPDKAGVDVGELCGIGPLGIAATDDVDALLALRPDCVVYTPFRPDLDQLERILGSGIDVVTTMYALAGEARIAAACERGGSSFYASGIYPGHAPMVALSATAMCERIDRLTVLESLDMSGYRNEAMFRAMGIDLPPEDPAAREAVSAACGSFREQIRVLAAALDAELDELGFDVELAVADETHEVGGMTIRAGHVAGFRGTVSGVVGGEDRIRCRFVWKMGDAMTPSWPVEHGYVVEVEGSPSFRLRLEPLGEHLDGAVTTAMPVVNAIPDVVAAPPGVLNHGGLPLVRGRHRVRP